MTWDAWEHLTILLKKPKMKCSLLLVAAPLASFMGVTSLKRKTTQNLTLDPAAAQLVHLHR